MINSGYGAMGGFDNFTDIAGLGSVFQSYMTGGAKKKRLKKNTKKKRPKRTPMRKALSSKAKSMSKMRMKNIRKLTQKQKKLEKRLKDRKIRTDVINSLASTKELPKVLEASLSPSMKKFVTKIPRDSTTSSSTSSLPSWPSLDEFQPVANKGRPSTKSFEDARKGLGDILKKKPVYPVDSRSVIKFSDYKSKLTPKEKASLKAKKGRR
jgi:hypothetical protein